MKICAIIPIKHISTRVPRKNYRNFNNKPLYYYIIKTLLSCDKISKIVVDTNSPIVKEGILEYFDEDIDIYDRPENLSSGDTPVNKLLLNVIEKLELNNKYDVFLQTHTTNPLLTQKTINGAIEKFLTNLKDNYDSLFSVKMWQTRLYKYDDKNEIKAINHNINELIPTQDLKPLYEENSCIYIFKYDILEKKKHRIGYKPLLFVMNDIESQDIDTESDFKIAELLHKSYENNNKVVLITGVLGGIGNHIAKLFKLNDWTVIGTDVLDNVNITNNENIYDLFIKEDISTVDGCKNIANIVNSKYNTLDCLINNAAYQKCDLLKDYDENEWDITYNTNVRACYLLSKYLYNLLKKIKGSIINISSVHSIATSKKIACYASSKGSISALTRAMSLEFAEDNIRVNSVSPGAINTPMLEDGLKRNKKNSVNENRKILESKHPCNFIGEPNDIAEMCLFLSDNKKSRYIYGQNFIVDGGATIKLSTE
jgi:CMP-N-acetylneuraminic acid synthetase/NAD(P)-dependent dehydrogenase (short-subunit alcohol dehydrogenase family)